jgi:transposase
MAGVVGDQLVHQLIADHTDDPAEVIVGIETDRGLLVGALVAAGYQLYALNPLAVSRYRDRHTPSRAKSDRGDAKVLADLVRTDRHNHRPIAADTELAEAIKVLARSHQNLIWTRQRQVNQLRSTLREFYPAALAAFDDLGHPDALTVLAKAPTPRRWAGACQRPRSPPRWPAPADSVTSTSGPLRSAMRFAPPSWPPRRWSKTPTG